MEWDGAGSVDRALFWNPAAISYLSQMMLALLLAGYLAQRALREVRSSQFHSATWLLAILMTALAGTFLASMLRVLTMGGWLSYAMPWSPLDGWATLAMPWARPFGGVAALAMVLLAYLFPQPLPGTRREMRLVTMLLAGLVAIETAVAVRADLAILAREGWWRPAWLAGWMHAAMVWSACVFWRQLAAVQAQPLPPPGLGQIGAGAMLIWRPGPSREAMIARAFLILIGLPILHTALLLFIEEGTTGFAFDMVLCWLAMLQLVGLTLVLVGYLPERTTFLFKLTVIGLTALLGAMNGAAWSILPAHQNDFRPVGLPQAGEALLFVPRGEGLGYAVQSTLFLPEPVKGRELAKEGERIDLPFAFPFYDQPYDHLYVGALGTIGFARVPQPVDAAFAAGAQGAIYPMLVEPPQAGTQIIAHAEADKWMLTRRDRCRPVDRARCYQLQTILHADGRIVIHVLDAPEWPRYRIFDPLGAPWLIGITPGPEATAGTGVLQDFQLHFAAHLDRLFRPLVLLLLLIAAAALIGLPLIFNAFLLAPLKRLIAGVRRFRERGLEDEVPVTFRDELGYLTESFNALTREQTAMRRGLEEEIAARVAQIADMKVRSTKLEERARLSADLHDTVAQTLASASLHASALPLRLAHLTERDVAAAEHVALLNRHALSEMRLLLTELREQGRQGALADRLRELVETFSQLHALRITVNITESGTPPPDVAAMFTRVAQEALSNIVKHSGTDIAELVCEASPERAMLVVRDHGRGFDPGAAGEANHLGLSIMANRAEVIGAKLEILAAPEQGCMISMSWGAGDGGGDSGAGG